MSDIHLRPATLSDASSIRRMVLAERLNPFSLDWRRFILAVDMNGQLLACVQVKPHADGTREMASLVVQPQFRGQRLARQMIEAVLASENGTLYLTCRGSLEPFYARFGFMPLPDVDLPPYFRRLRRLVHVLQRIVHLPENLVVMRHESQIDLGV